jgi:hypothetical protein
LNIVVFYIYSYIVYYSLYFGVVGILVIMFDVCSNILYRCVSVVLYSLDDFDSGILLDLSDFDAVFPL